MKRGNTFQIYFFRPKKDNSVRIILNLSDLNDEIVKRHFKMDTLQTAINLVTQDCYMASIDWKEAFYSVPVKSDHRKFLKFKWHSFNLPVCPRG